MPSGHSLGLEPMGSLAGVDVRLRQAERIGSWQQAESRRNGPPSQALSLLTGMKARAALVAAGILLAACGPLPRQQAISHAIGPTGPIREAHLFTVTSGWVLTDTGVFTTSDSGVSWTDVTPPTDSHAPFRTAFFLDPARAWAVVQSAAVDANGEAQLDVFSSTDGGRIWIQHPMRWPIGRLDTPGPVHLTFVDPLHGWMVVDTGSHAGFMYFIAFRTTDGGKSWSKEAFPASAPVLFITPLDGFSSYGVVGDPRSGAFVSHDGGADWGRMALAPPAQGVAPVFQLPIFADAATGVLAASMPDPSGASASELFYVSKDAGTSWMLAASVANPDPRMSAAPVSVMSDTKWLAAFYSTISSPTATSFAFGTRFEATTDGGSTWASLPAPLPAYLAEPISFAGSVGWAVGEQTGCRGFKTECFENYGLYMTTNGAQSWTPILLNQTSV